MGAAAPARPASTFTVDNTDGRLLYRVEAPTTPNTPRGLVVFVHGGGWIHQIAPQHWSLAADLAAAGAKVLVPIYPLAPKGTAQELVPSIADLIDEAVSQAAGVAVTVLGDSAGGNIAMAACQQLAARGSRQPDRLVLLSPVVDARLDHPEIPEIEPSDVMLQAAGVRRAAEFYAAALPLEDSLVSPIASPSDGRAFT